MSIHGEKRECLLGEEGMLGHVMLGEEGMLGRVTLSPSE